MELTVITQIIMIKKFTRLVSMFKNIKFDHHLLAGWKDWKRSPTSSLASQGYELVAIEFRTKFQRQKLRTFIISITTVL